MRVVDRWLQRSRMRLAGPYVRSRAGLFDVGCDDSAYIRHVRAPISRAVGIDPLADAVQDVHVSILRSTFLEAHLEPESFECITMLATAEPIDDAARRECLRLLVAGGTVVLTVPHAVADKILPALAWVGVADPPDRQGQHGFDVNATPALFVSAGFRSQTQRSFAIGLNRLSVFEKPERPGSHPKRCGR